jgi:hypothetical protein
MGQGGKYIGKANRGKWGKGEGNAKQIPLLLQPPPNFASKSKIGIKWAGRERKKIGNGGGNGKVGGGGRGFDLAGEEQRAV